MSTPTAEMRAAAQLDETDSLLTYARSRAVSLNAEVRARDEALAGLAAERDTALARVRALEAELADLRASSHAANAAERAEHSRDPRPSD